MEQMQVSSGLVCDQLPTLSVKYPWFVAQNLEAEVDDTKDQIFYTMPDALSFYRCRIPELLGRCIRGGYHGWVILSNHPHNVMWSLWNPVTSKMIRLPPLILKDGDFESIKQCCLSSPPNDPTSVLILTRTKTCTIVFCHIDHKRKKLRWKEMSYAKKLRTIAVDIGYLHCLTCCNGKVYALISGNNIVIQVDIVVKDKQLVISLLPFGQLPCAFYNGCNFMKPFLKGYCTELFYIRLGFVDEVEKKILGVAYMFKLDWNSMIWKEMEDLKDAIFLVNLAHDCSVFYRHEISSELKFNQPEGLLFFNPFTNDIREVPDICYNFDSVSFSAPPTSRDCIVVGLSASKLPVHAFVYFVNRDICWRAYRMDFGGTTPHLFLFSTFYGQDIYALNQGALNVFKGFHGGRPFWDGVVAAAPRGRECSSAEYFLVSCDRHLLLVVMDEFGKSVEVFKLNDSTQEWGKINSLGRHI